MSDQKLWDFHQDENRAHLKDSYPRQDMIAKSIIHVLPVGSKVLEIGFGDGYLLDALSRQGFEVIGQDLSEKNIEITKKQWNNDKISFILGDVSGKLGVEDNSIDGFVASEVLEHMDDAQLKICISEIYRILKKGGHAFLTFPARENLKVSECMCPNCGEKFHKWGHKQSWNQQKILQCFNGFDIVLQKEFVSRVKSDSLSGEFIGYLKYIGSHILKINKSYFLILKKG